MKGWEHCYQLSSLIFAENVHESPTYQIGIYFKSGRIFSNTDTTSLIGDIVLCLEISQFHFYILTLNSLRIHFLLSYVFAEISN